MAYPVRDDRSSSGPAPPRAAASRRARARSAAGQPPPDRRNGSICFLWPDEARDGWPTEPAPTESWYAARGARLGASEPGPASYGRDPGPPPPLRGLPGEARLANEAFMWAVDGILAIEAQGGSQEGNNHRHRRLPGPLHRHRTDHPLRVRVRPAPGRRRSGVPGDLAGVVGALPQRRGVSHRLRRHPVHPAIIARQFRVPAVSQPESAPQSCMTARW